jgi:multidrug efflux pump subunit AcrB
MNNIIAWFAENKVAANLLMVFLIVAGFITLSTIRLEVFPELSPDLINVSVIYQGAAPEEVEEGVCVRVEEAIQDLPGIKKMTSTASEGMGMVSVQVEPDFDSRQVLDDIKTRVDAINTFPLETEKPIVQETLMRRQVINVAVSGNTDAKTMKNIAEQIRDEINDLPEVSQVDLAGVKAYEVTIEVSEEKLRNYGLTFDEISRAVRNSSLDMPGGSIKTDGGEISLRTKGQAYYGKEFENIVLRSYPDGTRLRLSDVVTVNDGFAEIDKFSRFDGEPSVLVQVYRVGDENALTIADAVKEYLQEKRPTMPDGISITTWQDDSLTLKDRLNLLLRNARTGFILVFIMLALFLRLRLAIWVSIGMVISFFGAFWVMPMFGVSINMLSLFSFIMVLGIVVDDAIVIGENVYSHMQRGEKPQLAAIRGTQRVSTPVIFAVLTSVAAFSPLLGVPGMMGEVMRIIPIVVIATLLFSLVESLLILPAHLSHVNLAKADDHGKKGVSRFFSRIQQNFSNGLDRFITNIYQPVLETALKWRYTFMAVAIGTLILTMAIVAGGALKFTFMPNIEADNIVALLTLPEGSSVDQTANALEKLEVSADKLKSEFNDGENEIILHVLSTIGEQPYTQMSQSSEAAQGTNKPNIGEVNIQLSSAESRDVSSEQLAARWRELTEPIPGAEELAYSSSMFSTGDPVHLEMSGADYEELREAVQAVKAEVAMFPGVYDVADSYRSGKREIKLKLKPEAETLGLTLHDLARQVRQAFYGDEVQRIQRGRDDIRVMVRYPEEDRTSLSDLENMRVRLPNGGEVPFSVAADIDEGFGFSSISRTDRKRTIDVTANVDVSVANANEIMAEIQATTLPAVLSNFPTVSYSLGGEQAEQAESMGGIMQGFMIALMLIYVLLAIPFKSYIQPFIVMSAIPFGVVGAMWGHIIMGVNLSLLSFFGIIALAGVVINDSLVLVDFINKEREQGIALAKAIRDAGLARFRPILLTSITTFVGLTPLLLEKSPQAQFMIPMAISLAFGIIFGTVITLILVPIIYYSQEDAKALFAKIFKRKQSVQGELVEA